MTNPIDDTQDSRVEFPSDFAACIAEIISSWSALEHNIDTAIWHLAGVYPAIGACMTGQIYTLEGRLKGLQALLKLRKAPAKIITNLNKFCHNIREPLKIRNRIVHDCWLKPAGTKKQMKQLNIGAKGVLTYGINTILIDDLNSDLAKVRKSMLDAKNILFSIEDVLPTLPEIPLPELHPIIRDSHPHKQIQSNDGTFLLFPPKPSRA